MLEEPQPSQELSSDVYRCYKFCCTSFCYFKWRNVEIKCYQRRLVSQLYHVRNIPPCRAAASSFRLLFYCFIFWFRSNNSQLSVTGMESTGWEGRAHLADLGFGVQDSWARSCCAEWGLLLLLLLPMGACLWCEAPDPHRPTQSSFQHSSSLGSHHRVCSTRYSGTQTVRAALSSAQATPCFEAILRQGKTHGLFACSL